MHCLNSNSNLLYYFVVKVTKEKICLFVNYQGHHRRMTLNLDLYGILYPNTLYYFCYLKHSVYEHLIKVGSNSFNQLKVLKLHCPNIRYRISLLTPIKRSHNLCEVREFCTEYSNGVSKMCEDTGLLSTLLN